MRTQLKLAEQRILVTGATGFLGSHLCRSLSTIAREVHGVSRNPQLSKNGLQWCQGDLSNFATTRTILTNIQPDVIFHLSTHGWGAPGLENVQATLHSDLAATVNLLAAATELNVRRIVLTGSLEEPQPGNPDFVPSSPYAAAKWAGGAYARMFYRLYQTPIVIGRIAMTYGPGQPVQKLIPYTILSLLRGETPKISNGQRLVDWIYVDDVIRGLLAAAEAADVEGSSIELGSGSLAPIEEVVERIVSILRAEGRPLFGAPLTQVEPMRPANVMHTYQMLDWKVATPLHEGLELTVGWYTTQWKNNDRPSELRTLKTTESMSQQHASPEARSRT